MYNLTILLSLLCVFLDHSDCAVAKKILINQRSSLVTLHILPLVPSLLANNVINMDEKRKIEMKEKNELEGMSYFLNQVILPSLHENKMDKYKGFLATMAKHDDSLYQEIAKRLGKLLCSSGRQYHMFVCRVHPLLICIVQIY